MDKSFVCVFTLQYTVDLLLLCASSRLCRIKPVLPRSLCAASVTAAYSAFCTRNGFEFLLSPLWKIGTLALTIWIAFGISRTGFYMSAIYLLLNAAIGGISLSADTADSWSLLASALCICTIRIFVPAGSAGNESVPVVISYGTATMHLTALRDTGNMLRDPITGRPVLVVDWEAACKLTGLNREQLKSPAETICAGVLPGLRLIPYKTVGSSNGLLLAMRLKNVKIGDWEGSTLVAFAPERIGSGSRFQALTGGVI